MSKKTLSQGRFRIIVLSFIRLLLLLSIISAYKVHRPLVLILATTGIILTFVPSILQSTLKKKIPAAFEVTVLLFLYGLLLYWNLKLAATGFILGDILLKLGSAMILGLVGLTVLSVLNVEEIIDANSSIIAFFSFCFAFSLGALWEIAEYSLDTLLGFSLQGGIHNTMRDLITLALGSGIVAILGYGYLRSGKKGIFSLFITNFMKSNWKIFKSKKYMEYSSKKIAEIIQVGEGEKVEFKSTIRKNLYTKNIDKAIEHAMLKTIAAYLNTRGGTLLVGVDDKGNILGLENDDFQNLDKLKLYLNQILRTTFGSTVLRHVRYEVYPIQDKHVLRIDCHPTTKRVFLKRDGKEEFYVRYGPSTVQLSGEDLIDYINERFN